jgi:hypothetical protein
VNPCSASRADIWRRLSRGLAAAALDARRYLAVARRLPISDAFSNCAMAPSTWRTSEMPSGALPSGLLAQGRAGPHASRCIPSLGLESAGRNRQHGPNVVRKKDAPAPAVHGPKNCAESAGFSRFDRLKSAPSMLVPCRYRTAVMPLLRAAICIAGIAGITSSIIAFILTV